LKELGLNNQVVKNVPCCYATYQTKLTILEFRGNYIATSNSMKLVHWLLSLVQRGGDWAGLQPAQALSRCNKCNSPPINSQCST